MTVLRIDDIPLLYAQLKELGVQQIIDDVITPHGNWSGISLGYVTVVWLCYLLSESDHRLSAVESWVKQHKNLLIALSDQIGLTEKDFTDDRLVIRSISHTQVCILSPLVVFKFSAWH